MLEFNLHIDQVVLHFLTYLCCQSIRVCLATCDYVVELVVAEELIRSNLRVTRRIIPLGAVVGVVEHCVMLHILVFIQNLALKQAILVFFKVSATNSLM